MDRTREDNLRRLKEDMNNPLLPMPTRQKAHRTFENILRQIKDPTLVDMRVRLLKAHQAGDSEIAEKITMEINEYSKRAGYTTAG